MVCVEGSASFDIYMVNLLRVFGMATEWRGNGFSLKDIRLLGRWQWRARQLYGWYEIGEHLASYTRRNDLAYYRNISTENYAFRGHAPV